MIGWSSPKKILIILAHPDDPEFFCGASIYKWTQTGNRVDYLLMSKGEKGINDNFDDVPNIIKIREREQRNAADVLGVSDITYLDYQDGMMVPDIEARKKIVEKVRKHKPDILVTCDPTNYYVNDHYINHPDHRAAGQIVLDAIFPAVQNKLYFPSLLEKGLKPHKLEEVWITLSKSPNTSLDVTEEWGTKIKALECHTSQVGDIMKFRQRMVGKGIEENGEIHYKELFYRIVFR